MFENGQVAAVNYIDAAPARFADQKTKMLVQFRCAAGQVERLRPACIEKAQHRVDGLAFHHFLTRGAGIDVAMQAGLVALVAEVDLQCLKTIAFDGGKLKFVHQR